jgi:hypothetical protein
VDPKELDDVMDLTFVVVLKEDVYSRLEKLLFVD